MMNARNLMLTMLGGGTLAGLLLGTSIETTMKPAPEPPWRHAVRVDPSAASYQYVDSGPQDLSPYWPAGDRTPTWARRRMIDETPYYVPPQTGDEEDARLLAIEAEAADRPAADDAGQPQAPAPVLALPVVALPVTAAQNAADDARAAMAPGAAPAITTATTTAEVPQPVEDGAAVL